MVRAGDHFELENWVDFARGQFASEVVPRMQQHLNTGCEPCSRTARFWRRVVAFAARERKFNPPERDLRLAKALYHAFVPDEGQSWTLRIAHLLGQGQPAPAGVRGLGPSSNHYLFQEGEVLLDVQVDNQPERGVVRMAGQVFDPVHPEQHFEGKFVSLRHENEIVANSITGRFGEFQLQFSPQQTLLLVVELERKSYLVSALPAVTET
jgi:hypothetical protein